MYMYGFNMYYFLFMIPGLIITMWAQWKMKSTFSKYEKVHTAQGLTGAQAARMILDRNGLQNVQVQQVGGKLTDHYDPRTNVVSLSQATYNAPTIGGVGVAAHECGHAIQHAVGYGPIKVRTAIVPIANWGSKLSIPLIFVGFILNVLGLVYLGILLFGLAVLFQLVTLPVELNASRRAIETLNESGMVTADESVGVRKVLTAAAMTYLAALLTSLLQLLYYLMLALGRRR
ncbi:zinc metallopeptidase [Ruminococcaceae bacterium OttesenSCG-928-I18]|nr:zinc metallopeptidase [Ruminococcaceae bacterium OttesenSCG-928-I18]